MAGRSNPYFLWWFTTSRFLLPTSVNMRSVGILLFLLAAFFTACQPKTPGVCGLAYPFEGEGMPSRVLNINTLGFADTILASASVQASYLNQAAAKPEPGAGVLLQFNKPGTDSLVRAGICDAKGRFSASLPYGKYDLRFSYSGCNSLLLRNVKFGPGEIKQLDVLLGIQGAATKLYSIDTDKR